MVSTQRSAADNTQKAAAAKSSKGIKAWFMRQPKWLRIVMIVVIIIMLPLILSVVIGLIKAVIGLIARGVKSMKTRFAKPLPMAEQPVDEKSNLEGK
jgi:Na+/H+-translocating membrane pyrophosphatase